MGCKNLLNTVSVLGYVVLFAVLTSTLAAHYGPGGSTAITADNHQVALDDMLKSALFTADCYGYVSAGVSYLQL